MAKKRTRRRSRRGEFTCRCGAYAFPHRMFGGKCTGLRWVRMFWARDPHAAMCGGCHCYVMHECQVDMGLEAARHAECLQDLIHNEEIRTPRSWIRAKSLKKAA